MKSLKTDYYLKKIKNEIFSLNFDIQKIKKYLLELNLDLNIKDNEGNGIIQYLILRGGYSKEIDFILNNGGDVNIINGLGDNLLGVLFNCLYIDLESLNVLLKHGVDIFYQNSNTGNGIFHNYNFSYIFQNHKNIVGKIVNMGLDLNIKNKNGESVLFFLISEKNFFKYLYSLEKKYGLKLNIKNKKGENLFHHYFSSIISFNNGNDILDMNLIDYLVKKGLDINKLNNQGKMPIECLSNIGLRYFSNNHVIQLSKKLNEKGKKFLYNINNDNNIF